jgi:hypothetical protein
MGIPTVPFITRAEVRVLGAEEVSLFTTVSEGLWVYPASYSVDTEGFFPGIKS